MHTSSTVCCDMCITSKCLFPSVMFINIQQGTVSGFLNHQHLPDSSTFCWGDLGFILIQMVLAFSTGVGIEMLLSARNRLDSSLTHNILQR